MNARTTFSIVLILLGIGFLLDSFEYMEFSQTISDWWPLLIIALGISHLARKKPPVFTGLLIIGVGILLLADNLNYITGGFWDAFWPLLLVIFGISVLLPGGRFLCKHNHHHTDGDLNTTTIFSGQHKKINDRNFKGGNVSALFGGAEIDLTEAELSSEGAVLNLNAAFGSIEVFIPTHWHVKISGTPIFGGFEDKTKQDKPSDDSRILNINYNVIFGGIEIRN
ncbi:LiaI-LiaF-like domain-containing protein [Bacteroidota bacterium]